MIRFLNIFIILCFILLVGCKKETISCKEITIENRWNKRNDGIASLTIFDEKELKFICEHLNGLVPKDNVLALYNYGYLEIYLDGKIGPINMIFTVENDVLFRFGIGKFASDKELTTRIMKLMKINSKIWETVDR